MSLATSHKLPRPAEAPKINATTVAEFCATKSWCGVIVVDQTRPIYLNTVGFPACCRHTLSNG